MLKFVSFSFFFLALSIAVACSNGDNGGTGGVPAAGGSGGTGAVGGAGGTGGAGGGPRTCVNPRDCDDGEPCTEERCDEQICAYDPLPDDTSCVTETGLSACVDGRCQPIWNSCNDPTALDGDFCQPDPPEVPARLGRCDGGDCVVDPCQVGFDCWSGEACQVGVCDGSTGECSTENRPDGTACFPPAFGQCSEGTCTLGGGSGGSGGQGGGAGQGGSGA